jgi:acetyl-CoA C-acetyltransferase
LKRRYENLMSLPVPVYIVAAKRTPIGSYMGVLKGISAPQLGAASIEAALAQAKLDPSVVGEVFMGHVLTAGVGQAPARQAARFAGIPDAVPSTTINKVCGSGLQAVILGAKTIALGDASIVVAGGMESMSRVPYYLQKAREGYRMGNGELVDGMIFDGLWDPYDNVHMGNCGDLCAKELDFTREQQDDFAKESYRRALAAQNEGLFAAELTQVSVPQRRGEATIVSEDEEPGRGKPEKFPKLRAAFGKEGTVTAANASSINDGGCALILASEQAVKDHGLEPLARIEGYAGAAQEPKWFTTAPAKAIDNALSKLKLEASQIGLHEINEAFSVVTMACAKLCAIDLENVNVRGGAVALGHPIGASGARILTTLLYAMKDRSVERGMASICIGGGEALALVAHRS